jgi:hypothetical protein
MCTRIVPYTNVLLYLHTELSSQLLIKDYDDENDDSNNGGDYNDMDFQ